MLLVESHRRDLRRRIKEQRCCHDLDDELLSESVRSSDVRFRNERIRASAAEPRDGENKDECDDFESPRNEAREWRCGRKRTGWNGRVEWRRGLEVESEWRYGKRV